MSIPKDKCTGCMACYNVCSKNAIHFKEDEEGFLYPSIDQSICVDCGLCYLKCPVVTDESKTITPIKACYYGINIDKNVQRLSSSGGVFAAVSKLVIERGGVVFGAAFDYDNLNLCHFSSEEKPLVELQKSKYVQSYIGDIYKKVKSFVKQGRQVLFVGTPCQCAGLSAYLGKENYDNLLICDFICHGVPPMAMLREHLNYLKLSNKHIGMISFRPKIKSWVDYFIINDGEKILYKSKHQYDPYYSFFMKFLSLRRCCYQCEYSEGFRKADFSIADYWGYHRYDKNIYDKDGLSLVIAYSEKAYKMIEEINGEYVKLFPLEEKYVKYAYKKPVGGRDARDRFFTTYIAKGYQRTAKEYGFSHFKTTFFNMRDNLIDKAIILKRGLVKNNSRKDSCIM